MNYTTRLLPGNEPFDRYRFTEPLRIAAGYLKDE
jgi:hypothetical protein